METRRWQMLASLIPHPLSLILHPSATGYANWHSGQFERLVPVGSSPTSVTETPIPWSNGKDASANYPTTIDATTKVATTAKHWKVRNNHFGCEIRNARKATATAAKRTDKASNVAISSRIHPTPPGATVIADETTRATANKAQRYQDIVVTLIANSSPPYEHDQDVHNCNYGSDDEKAVAERFLLLVRHAPQIADPLFVLVEFVAFDVCHVESISPEKLEFKHKSNDPVVQRQRRLGDNQESAGSIPAGITVGQAFQADLPVVVRLESPTYFRSVGVLAAHLRGKEEDPVQLRDGPLAGYG
jgi:hypothetical protein